MADEGLIIGLFVAAIGLAGSLLLGLEYVKRFGAWLRGHAKPIVVVLFWTAMLSSVTVWEYYSLYEKYSFLRSPSYAVAFAPTWSQYIPRLYALDYIIVLAASVLAGFAIADIEDTLFGFLASSILSTLISFAYVTFFIWYVLGFGLVLDSSFITTMMWAALLNVFRMIFPLALLVTFLGSIFGSFFRDLVQPSAQN